MSKICPRENYKDVHEELSWQIREKELEISHILSKTLFWHEKVDPLLAKEIIKKEEFLSSWYESQKNRKAKTHTLKHLEDNLREIRREISTKKRLMDDYYEYVGCLALQDYQKNPAKWSTYENVFDSALLKLKKFISKMDDSSNPIHFFLASTFNAKQKIGRPLKDICRPVGEKVMQLNLANFIKKEGENYVYLADIEYHEHKYASLLKKKRSLETKRNHLYHYLSCKTSWWSFFKDLFNPASSKDTSPKLIMLELERFYTKILKEYLEDSPEKVPVNMARALQEFKTLKEKKAELEHCMLFDKAEQNIKNINIEKLSSQRYIEQLEERLKQQRAKLEELEEKEKKLELYLKGEKGEEEETSHFPILDMRKVSR